MEIELDRVTVAHLYPNEVERYLYRKGLDVKKPYKVWENPDCVLYIGEALPGKESHHAPDSEGN